MKKIIPTILLTSAFWLILYILIAPKAENKKDEDTVPGNTVSYAGEIVGEWSPVELAEEKLNFSQYGVMRIGDDDYGHSYSVDDDILEISMIFGDNTCRFAISSDDTGTYLEIFDDPVFAGKYKKVRTEYAESVKPQPTHKPAAKGAAGRVKESKTTKAARATNPADNAAPAPKLEQRPAATEPEKVAKTDYPAAITGRWEPVEGVGDPLEITKYGTLIQWRHGSLDYRHEYSLDGDRMKTWNSKDTRVAISEDGGNTCLEMFNNKELSGKYRLSKKAPEVDAEDIGAENYRTAIAGKWQPVFGTSDPLEITKYGTLIQWRHGSLDYRHEYSLEGDRMKTWNSDNTRVAISRNAKGTYLEIYNNKELSGLYMKQ